MAQQTNYQLHQYLKSMECQEDHQNQLAKVRKNRKIKQKVSENSTLKQDLNKISTSERERESLQKPFDISYFLVMKGQPINDFSEHISYKKMHGVKFSIGFKNFCTKFISLISKSIFDI